MKSFFLFLLLAFKVFAADTIKLEMSKELPGILAKTIMDSPPGTIIVLPAGKFDFKDEVIVNTSHITLKGQGPSKTILSFKNQEVGAQGIIATKDAFTIEDMAIEDTKGDGIKVERSNGVTIRNVRVEWTNGPDISNGSYGVYPVQTQNVLIEKCIVKGASDAGIYVGQSHNIIVRKNLVELNVAGIEIENSRYADVYDNHARHNTAGILVFDLPNLAIKGGKQTRVFNNLIELNNTENFAPKGNIVGGVPSGTGVMIIANDDIEIFNNKIIDNFFTGIILANYRLSGNKIQDKTYNARVDRINIHDNVIQRFSEFKIFPKIFETKLHFLAYYLTALRIPEVINDGVEDGSYMGTRHTEETKVCIQNNFRVNGEKVDIANLHADSEKKSLFGQISGGPVEFNSAAYNCRHISLAKIELEPVLPIPGPTIRLPQQEVSKLCSKKTGKDPNYNAFNADCPKLSDYNLFEDPADPTQRPNGKVKLPYVLSSALFTDYALKDRIIFLPPKGTMDFHKTNVLRFPIGTMITKTFKFPKNFSDLDKQVNLIETRILVNREDGWHALPYVWNHVKKDAFLARGGASVPVDFTLANGVRHSITYEVPNENKCSSCHSVAGELTPIGPQAKLLNFVYNYPGHGEENQLRYMFNKEVLKGNPDPVGTADKVPNYMNESASLNQRAKAYLHINCAHCHQPNGRARTSGLYLEYERDHSSPEFGNCKPPVAAGRGTGLNRFVIEPGVEAHKSIMYARVDSSDPGSMMPEVGRSLVHKEGVQIIKKWIESLPFEKCDI